jgi:dTDP-4-amino-4,6-dideoxygalactose transaminase
MSQNIPLLNLQAQYQKIGHDIETAVLNVLRSGHFILGQYGALLESQVAELCGCDFGVGVGNGTDALVLALMALDIGPGDEVITTPFTFAATVEAISLRGATPVFVDVYEDSFNINASQIERVITSKTKAIMPIHLYGQPADMDTISAIAKAHGLKVIEDNAQAIGATYKGKPTGSFGDVACLSFYPTKNLGAAGDAGMVVTKDAALFERLRSLRAHGMKRRYYHDELGVNSRLDEIQAAVLVTKLPHLAEWTRGRQAAAKLYDRALNGCSGIITPKLSLGTSTVTEAVISHVWHQYTIRVNAGPSVLASTARDTVVEELSRRGIGSMCYYPVALHLQQAFQHLGHKRGDFPVSEKLADEVLSIPMYAELTPEQISHVAESLRDIMSQVFALTMPVTVPVTPPVLSI